jgi:hypothetical protein
LFGQCPRGFVVDVGGCKPHVIDPEKQVGVEFTVVPEGEGKGRERGEREKRGRREEREKREKREKRTRRKQGENNEKTMRKQ